MFAGHSDVSSGARFTATAGRGVVQSVASTGGVGSGLLTFRRIETCHGLRSFRGPNWHGRTGENVRGSRLDGAHAWRTAWELITHSHQQCRKLLNRPPPVRPTAQPSA